MFDNFSALKNNIRLLGDSLGEALRDSEGEDLFNKVEGIRQLSKAARSGEEVDRTSLTQTLESLSNDELVPVAQAYAQFLNLVNIAEQFQTVSGVQQEDNENFLELDNLYSRLKDKNLSDDEIGRALAQLKIELVLTAHPTEIARRTLIHKYSEIANCLAQLELAQKSPGKIESLHLRLKELVVQAWHTNQIRDHRPTPIDEAKWGFAVVENSLWDAVPRYLRQLDRVQRNYLGRSLPLEATPIRFVSWMGGDRDGNPNVTAQVTRRALLLSREKAVELYLRDVDVLISELSITPCNDEVKQLSGGATEPYRKILRDLQEKLLRTLEYLSLSLAGQRADERDIVAVLDDLWQPLYACYRSLHEVGIAIVADGLLLDCLRRVRCFGVHLVRLDIRQESGKHSDLMSELTRYLELGDYAQWDEARKQEFLLQELGSKRPLVPKHWQPSEMSREVLETFAAIAEQPRQALGAYVISMATAPSDVLAVRLLLKEADCPFDMPVAPLFETLDDLNRCAGVMDRLLSLEDYRAQTGGRQVVMIGYSDSAKDAGAMAAQWAQYRAQEALIAVCERQGIELTLFHGRGGTIGRGGSPAHAALLSQPPGSLKGGLRVTEQGEMIRVKLGLPDVAVTTFNIYTSAILEAHLQPPPEPKPSWREIMDRLARESCAIYRGTVYDTEDFIDYFKLATPESELAKLPLGSRPAKRRPEGGVESLRAIPWIFAWTQNRLMLPAWLGAGAALRSAIDAGDKMELEAMCRDWPFFSTRLGMLEMVYSKADLALSRYYEQRLVPESLWPLGQALRAQLESDIKAVLAISNEDHLMEDHPWIQKAVQLRNIYTDPLNLLQAELLCRYRQQSDSRVEQALMVTIAGIAAGMRNTG